MKISYNIKPTLQIHITRDLHKLLKPKKMKVLLDKVETNFEIGLAFQIPLYFYKTFSQIFHHRVQVVYFHLQLILTLWRLMFRMVTPRVTSRPIIFPPSSL